MNAKDFVKLAEFVDITATLYCGTRARLRRYGGSYIKDAMRLTGLGVRALARATGYSPTFISAVRHGKMAMSSRMMTKLGEVVKTTLRPSAAPEREPGCD